MKIRIELVENLDEEEVLIRCSKITESIHNIQKFISEQSATSPKIVFFKQHQEFYFPLDHVLFFETEGDAVFAHTRKDAYLIKHRLYELEELLPRDFARVSKSTIVNLPKIHSITRNITASSLVQFSNSYKQIYVSRHYYRELRERLQERTIYEI